MTSQRPEGNGAEHIFKKLPLFFQIITLTPIVAGIAVWGVLALVSWFFTRYDLHFLSVMNQPDSKYVKCHYCYPGDCIHISKMLSTPAQVIEAEIVKAAETETEALLDPTFPYRHLVQN